MQMMLKKRDQVSDQQKKGQLSIEHEGETIKGGAERNRNRHERNKRNEPNDDNNLILKFNNNK